MDIRFPYKIHIQFPGDLDYIPPVRKFVSEMLQVSNFTPRFAYRSEIIVDEICNNAVNYGCVTNDAKVELVCEIKDDHVDFQIKDEGGSKEHIRRLRQAMHTEEDKKDDIHKRGLGLEIVKMLSEKIDLEIDSRNLTSIHVVRKREDIEREPKQ